MQLLIKLFGEKLQLSGCNIIHALGDADLMVAQIAVQSAMSITTALEGDDTDLLVLLCHHADTSAPDLFHSSAKAKVNDEKDLGHQENQGCTGIRKLGKKYFSLRISRMGYSLRNAWDW